MRQARKDEHIEKYLKTTAAGDTLFDCVYVEHNSLPEIDFDEIDTSLTFLGKKISFPLMINAMTGGTDMTESINEDLSMLAKEFNLPMAVGSQQIALDDEKTAHSFQVIREALCENCIVIGNLSAQAGVEDVKKAMDMIQADAMGLHLNPAQELVQSEGDRSFKGIEENIRNVTKAFPGKVIVKEVGFGVSKSVAQRLVDAGVTHLDISGAGGTNFLEIEDLRDNKVDFTDLYGWGIPTAAAILNARSVSDDLFLISSGGVKTAQDILKSIVLGADLTAMSGEILRYLLLGGYEYTREYLEGLILKTKIMMALVGARNLDELKNVPYKLTGKLKDLAE